VRGTPGISGWATANGAGFVTVLGGLSGVFPDILSDLPRPVKFACDVLSLRRAVAKSKVHGYRE